MKEQNSLKEQNKTKVKEIASTYPKEIQSLFLQAYEKYYAGECQETISICQQILKIQEPGPDVKMLIVYCYVNMKQYDQALPYLKDLINDYPEEQAPHYYLGKIYEHDLETAAAIEEYKKIYPLKEYIPYYYASYALELLSLGNNEKKAYQLLQEEIDHYEMTEEVYDDQMLLLTFDQLLRLDGSTGSLKLDKNMSTFIHYIDSSDKDSNFEFIVAKVLLDLSYHLAFKNVRSPFIKLANYAKEIELMKREKNKLTLDSAFTAYESYLIHEDRKINSLMETFLQARGDYLSDINSKLGNNTEDLTYQWYMCQYYPDHKEEFEYIKETYPYSYQKCIPFIEKVRKDPQKYADELCRDLSRFSLESPEKIRIGLQKLYKKVLSLKKMPAYIHNPMETYKRIQPKVGRNDPCPCGSGKKYKKCCGRNQ